MTIFTKPPSARRRQSTAPTAARTRRGSAALVVMLAAAAPACSSCRDKSTAVYGPGDAGKPTAPQVDPNERVDALVKEHLDGLTASSPTAATWLGIHGLDDRLDDLSLDAQTREVARLRRVLDRAEAMPEARLDDRHRLDRQLLLRDARVRLFDLSELRPLDRNPLRYVDVVSSGVTELLARDFAPLPDRLHSLVGRLWRIRPVLDEARRNLKNPPELHTRRAIELVQSARAFIGETLPRVYAAVSDERMIADFRNAQGDAVRALDDFAGYLQRDLLPRSKGDFAIGRDKLYERFHLAQNLDLPPEQFPSALLTVVERDLKVADKRYEEAAHQLAPGKSAVEAQRLLEDDHPQAEQLLASVGATLDQLFAFARDRHLLPGEDTRPKVVEMPPFLWGFLLLVEPGPFEGHGSGVIYVDPVDDGASKKTREDYLRAYNRPQVVTTLAHEVLGRAVFVQAARRSGSTMRRLALDGVFEEGWAAYVAQLVLDEGFGGNDPKLRLAQRREAVLALCRAAAVLRLHALGAKVDDVVHIFVDSGDLDEVTARREAERAAVDPWLAEGGLGMIAIQKLRDDMAKAEGAAFTVGGFHEALLAQGAVPLSLLRQRLLPGSAGQLW